MSWTSRHSRSIAEVIQKCLEPPETLRVLQKSCKNIYKFGRHSGASTNSEKCLGTRGVFQKSNQNIYRFWYFLHIRWSGQLKIITYPHFLLQSLAYSSYKMEWSVGDHIHIFCSRVWHLLHKRWSGQLEFISTFSALEFDIFFI